MNVFIAEIQGNEAVLMPEESWHCAKVLRFRAGDHIRVIDGKGGAFDARLGLVTEKQCRATITAGPIKQSERGCRLHLAVAPTKQIDRTEWMLEKAVEIGIDEMTFIQCKNSERTSVRHDRMQKIAESAVKQSLQSRLPVINGLVQFGALITKSSDELKLIAHCHDESRKPLNEFHPKGKSVLAVVGPEGDFTQEEITTAKQAQFESILLGPNRLRTETAGLYMVQAINLLL
jgi:16S rRNA (uracil1498-N3)-methyltransferase